MPRSGSRPGSGVPNRVQASSRASGGSLKAMWCCRQVAAAAGADAAACAPDAGNARQGTGKVGQGKEGWAGMSRNAERRPHLRGCRGTRDAPGAGTDGHEVGEMSVKRFARKRNFIKCVFCILFILCIYHIFSILQVSGTMSDCISVCQWP
jgi:hypothetical protein